MLGNACGIQDALGRFHHRPDRQIGDQCCQRIHIGGAIHLGQEDRVTLHRRNRSRIRRTPFRIEPVDPHDFQTRTIAAIRKGSIKRIPRRDLGVRRNSVFQIKQDHINRQPPRLLQGPIFGPRDIEGGAVRAAVHRIFLAIMLRGKGQKLTNHSSLNCRNAATGPIVTVC